MSLHHIAQHLQSTGRNGDSMLVHMTPGEVSGLQALAKAHGGSLTINPETGLPEAFFLAGLLPTILGAGAAATGMSALNAALLTGAIGTAVTGDLGQGIMMGLGAYGGAGLGGALSKMGTAATAAPAANVASAGGVEGLKQGIFGGAPKVFNPAATASTLAPTTAAAPGALDLTGMMSKAGMPTGAYPVTASMPTQTPMFDITSSVNAGGSAMAPDRFADLRAPTTVPQSFIDKLGAGAKKATSGIDGLKEFYKTSEEVAPGSSMASLASAMYNMQGGSKPAKDSESLIRPYRFHRTYTPEGGDDTGYGTSERRYFDDRFEALEPYAAPGPEYAADGGLMGIRRFADGGYTRYTGDNFYGEYDPKKDDYYYVPGSTAGPGYFMVRDGTQGSAGGAGGATGPYAYDYDREAGKFIQKAGPGMDAPKLSTNPKAYNAESLNPLYQQYFGRDVDPEGLAAYTGRNFSPAQLDEIFKASPEYAARQQQLAAQKKEASYATATQAANMYQDILGRPIDRAALDFYTQEQRMTPADLKKTLMSSEEYLTNLTKPFVPPPQVNPQTGQVSIAGALRTPQQEAARPRDMSDFYAMMDRELAQQGKKQGAKYAVGGPVEQMSAMNAIGGNEMYPQSQFQTPSYSNPMVQRPMPTNVISQGLDALVDRYSGEQRMAGGGLSSLGGYSDGGRLLKGPGDGVSDSIPAVIGKRQPARLADGEFVVPARIVSEIGNGSTEAGARKLYAMMDRVQKARGKTVGKGKVAKNTKAEKYLPA